MCLAYAENTLARMGKMVNDLIYINVTDGVGAGIVYKNQVMMGSDSSAGEIGHVSIDYRASFARAETADVWSSMSTPML